MTNTNTTSTGVGETRPIDRIGSFLCIDWDAQRGRFVDADGQVYSRAEARRIYAAALQSGEQP